ncbi:MAG: hypothetical protein ABL953_07340 [Ilumatobacteraceae bacterium]
MTALGVSRLLPVLGVAGLAVGGTLGFTVLSPDDDGSGGVAVDVQQYSLYDCPDGALVGSAYAGDRVFVTGRDESGGWLEIRDPRNESVVLWVPTGAVDPDAVIDVPVHECEEPIEAVVVDESTTTTVTTDTTPVTDPPASDDQAPVASPPNASPGVIYDGDTDDADCPETATITVTATDNVAVTQVTGTYTGVGGSPKAFSKGAGNTWTATFGPFSELAPAFDQDITIVIVARDAAGNSSNAVQTSVSVRGAGNCLG